MNVADLQQEVFTSREQALNKYWREELKIETAFFRPIVLKEESESLPPCSKGILTMRFVLTETGENRWQYVLVNSEE